MTAPPRQSRTTVPKPLVLYVASPSQTGTNVLCGRKRHRRRSASSSALLLLYRRSQRLRPSSSNRKHRRLRRKSRKSNAGSRKRISLQTNGEREGRFLKVRGE